MKIFDSRIEDGNVNALILVSHEEILDFGSPEGAIENAIQQFSKDKNTGALMYIRVLEMDYQDDGAVMFSFEAAVTPEVKLGKYKNFKLECLENQDLAQMAIDTAAGNLEMTVPGLIIDRKLDSMAQQKKAEILQSGSVNAAADMEYILHKLNDEEEIPKSPEELWDLAMKAAVTYNDMGYTGVEPFVYALGQVTEADENALVALTEERLEEKQSMNPQLLADELFEVYLKIRKQSYDDWRQENYRTAAELCRVDFLLSAVAEKEKIKVTEEEMGNALFTLSDQYQMTKEDILQLVSREALEYQIKLGKARKIITETAKRI